MSNNTEYAFRFPLQPVKKVVADQNAVSEIIRLEIESLLELIVLTSGGKPVSVDGFYFFNDPERLLLLRPSPRFHELTDPDSAAEASIDHAAEANNDTDNELTQRR